MSSTQAQAVLALIFLRPTLRAEATSYAMKNTYWKPLCQTAKALRTVPQASYGKLSSLLQEEAAARQLSLQISVYAMAHAVGSEKMEIQAAAAALQTLATNRRTTLSNFAKTALQATQSTSELVGEIEGVMTLFKQTKHGAAFCLGDASAASDGTKDYSTAGCRGRPLELTQNIPPIAADVVGNNGFANLAEHNTGIGATDNKCPLLEATGTAGTHVFKHSDNPAFIQGLIKVTGDNTVGRDSQQNQHPIDSRNSASLLQLAYHDAKQVKEDPTTRPITEPIQLLTAIAKNGNLKSALEHELKALAEESEHSKIPTKATSIINEKYKHDTNKLETLWNNIKTKEVKDVTQAGTKPKQIQQITELTILQATLNYYINSKDLKITSMEEEINKLKENSGKSVENAGEKICNAIGDANREKCNGEKQCSYDDSKETGKKCTFDATKAAANGVPVTKTQTGGSETTTWNFKGKLQEECTKAPECKWENNAFKDSIFMVNNKLAPVVYGFTSFVVFSKL
uniref:Variant surface glycoprotein 703 n=1 Tax=Trypanosoma brucei TaxID=5691 RepID=M4SU74_9TRYP|nr:variant surface glycoprotein 703 [Trypanosoma brucei]